SRADGVGGFMGRFSAHFRRALEGGRRAACRPGRMFQAHPIGRPRNASSAIHTAWCELTESHDAAVVVGATLAVRQEASVAEPARFTCRARGLAQQASMRLHTLRAISSP